MVKILRHTFILLFFSLTFLKAQTISVSAATDTNSYKVGDYIKYQIEIKHDKLISVNMPAVKDSIKVLDYIETLPAVKNEVDNQIVERYTYVFSKYDSANVTIPPVTIEYYLGRTTSKKLIKTNSVSITIRTLPVNAQEDIRDVKNPLKLPLNWLLILAITVIILLLLALLYYLYRRYRKKKELKENIITEIKIPPHEIALTGLHELEDKKLWQNGFVKQFHSEVTEIVRQYFEGRFNFRALEMTSSEILAVLSYKEEGKKIVQFSDNFFSNADLVKFAKFEPMPKVNDEMMKQAYEIVNQTIPVPVENIVSEDKNVQ